MVTSESIPESIPENITAERTIEGDAKQIIDGLVAQFDRLFGRASHEVSREAAAGLVADLPPMDVPMSLRS